MSRSLHGTIGAALLSCLALSSQSQTQPAPAAKGQTPDQQSTDEQQCYDWAKTQTGIDPTAPPPAPAATEEAKGGQRVKGAARGAAAGAIVGEVANNDADEGACLQGRGHTTG